MEESGCSIGRSKGPDEILRMLFDKDLLKGGGWNGSGMLAKGLVKTNTQKGWRARESVLLQEPLAHRQTNDRS